MRGIASGWCRARAAMAAGVLAAMMAVSALWAADDLSMWRTWRSRSGSAVHARLVEVQGDRVILQSTDGKTVAIQRANLSAADQARVDAVAPPVEVPPPPTPPPPPPTTTVAPPAPARPLPLPPKGGRSAREPQGETIEDAVGDFLRGETHHPAYLDLRSITLTRMSARELAVAITVGGNLPDQVQRYTMIVLNLDLDREKKTGYSFWQVGAEVGVQVTRDPRLPAWTGEIRVGEDGTQPAGYSVENFRVRKNETTFVIRAPDPDAFDRFLFSCHSYVLPEKAVDLLPESGGHDVTTRARQ